MKKDFDFDDIGKRRLIVCPKVFLMRCNVRCKNALMLTNRQIVAYG